jgi:hypothetical protein
VLIFALSGVLGFAFLLQTLNRLCIAQQKNAPLPKPIPPDWETSASTNILATSLATNSEKQPEESVKAEIIEDLGALDRVGNYFLGKHVKSVFTCWVILFGLVGAQMSWVLRPFIGAPGDAFHLFRGRGSNFFEAVMQTLRALFS